MIDVVITVVTPDNEEVAMVKVYTKEFDDPRELVKWLNYKSGNRNGEVTKQILLS